MEDNYNSFTYLRRSACPYTLLHWIATLPMVARNDVCDRHCEGVSPWQSSALKCRGKKSGFSLIELLISLIIISLIISSFIPILTKKMKHHNATISAGIMDCKKFDEKCMLCDKKECTLCTTQINLLDGQYVDPKLSCEVKQCPNNCAKCDKQNCLQCEEGFKLNNSKECSSYTDAPCLEIGNICVAKFNAGDNNGLEIPDGLVTLKATVTSKASSGGEHTQAICWRGNNTIGCDAANGGYSGCNRTVCSWGAADKICKYHGWRLPTDNELNNFAVNSIAKKANGLQLCDYSANYLSARCTHGNKCADSHHGYCGPANIWSANVNYAYGLNGGEWAGPNLAPASNAFSVRCVRDL